MKHDPRATASAAALTVGILYIVCRVAVGMFPSFSYTVMQSWFHGLAITPVAGWGLSSTAFVLGLVTATASAGIVGWCFAHCYNMFARRGK